MTWITFVGSFSGIPEDMKVRCVLFWRTEHTHEAHELSYALIRHYEQIVVAGGYVDHFLPEDELARVNDEYVIFQFVLFLGGRGVCYALIRHYEQIVVAGGYVDHFLPEDEMARVNYEYVIFFQGGAVSLI